MFYRYAYRKENGKTCLYLYKTTKFEFAKEALNIQEEHDKTLEDEALSFVRKKKLPTAFSKLYIIVDGNLIKTLSKDQIDTFQKEKREPKDETKLQLSIKIGDHFEEISLFKYLVGTLFTSYIFPLKKETLKVLAILYRTYALDQLKEKGYVEAKNPFVIYRDPLLYKLSYSNTFLDTYNLLRQSVLETQGLYIVSQGNLIKPYVHTISSGRTKTNQKDPYLVAKDSLWDLKAKNYLQQFFFTYQELTRKFSITKENLITYSRKDLAALLSLPSLDFTCIEEKEGITILSRGVGNDLGLSLFGANYLAEQGFNYSQILAYYFQKIILYKI